MTDDTAFVRSLLDNPQDDTTRLVWADWLEERNDPRAAVVREQPEAVRLLGTVLRRPSTGVPRHEYLEDTRLALGLALLLESFRDKPELAALGGGRALAEVAMIEQHFLARGGAEGVEALLTLLGRRPLTLEEASRYAGQLATHRPAALLRAAFDRHLGDVNLTDLLACLAQEFITREQSLDDQPRVRAFAERLAREGHPLADLPLHRHPLEAVFPTILAPLGSGQTLTTGSLYPAYAPLAVTGSLPETDETTTPAWANRVLAVAGPWERHSLFRTSVEARSFTVLPGQAAAELNLVLTHLGLSCLAGGASAEVHLAEVDADEVLGYLFLARALDPESRQGSAGLARWVAWDALAALADAETPLDVDGAAAQAERCRWGLFRTAWHEGSPVLGVVCLRPGGRTLAVLAATVVSLGFPRLVR